MSPQMQEKTKNSREVKFMKLVIALLVVLGSTLSQAQTTTGKAQAEGTCVLANSGHIQNVIIRCGGLDKTQGQQMIAILNKILENQQKLPLDEVMAKLDEILRNTNPNLAVVTYRCDGLKMSRGPGPNAMEVMSNDGRLDPVHGGITSKNIEIYRSMLAMIDAHQWTQLLSTCKASISGDPGWLTTRLFCSAASEGLGKQDDARAFLTYYDDHVGPGYDAEVCPVLSGNLHKALGQP
jgi:hypothetical protein